MTDPTPERDSPFVPERFREDYDPEPYLDPEHAGPDYRHVDPRDVLSPEEYNEWKRQRGRR